jgi:ABC-type multidrug transport system fused ATPase/permease subunit
MTDRRTKTDLPSEPGTLQKLWFLIPSAQRKQIPLLLTCLIIGASLEVVGIGLLVPLINLLTDESVAPSSSVLSPLFETFNASTQIQMLTVGFASIGLLVLVKNAYLVAVSYYQNWQILKLKSSIENQMFKGYVNADYAFHLRVNSSLLTRNLTVEVPQVTLGVVGPVMSVAIEGLTVAGIVALLLYFQPTATLVLVAFLILCAVTYTRCVSPLLIRLGEQRTELNARTLKTVVETLGGVKQLKVIGKEKFFQARFATISSESHRVSIRTETIQKVPAYLVELWAVLGLLVVVFTLLLQGVETKSVVSSLGLFVGASFRFVPSFNRILVAAQILKLAKAPIGIVYQEIARQSDTSIAKDSVSFHHSLQFKNVSFSYESTLSPVLEGVSFDIVKGQSIGFVGASGTGKTTLVDLLLGLLAPTSGEVRIDGVPIDLNRHSWKSDVGYVPQEIFLIDDTIRSNIAFGVDPDNISESLLATSVETSQLSGLMKLLPDGLDTVIGERGVRLSGGQRQRIGIARALYHQPSLLVLDEATSALDLETEREFIEAIESVHSRITMVVVSHRMSTLKYCDRVFRVESARLQEICLN